MSYVLKILRPGEQIIVTGKLHWIIYLPAIVLVLLSFVIFGLGFHEDPKTEIIASVLAFVAAPIGVVLGIMAWFKQWTAEIVVTNHRVIYKKGFIRRHTAEMNMDKVESVTVDQTIMGRVLDYGAVDIRGTGEGFEHLHGIGSPIVLRNAILAR
jgi:uncharacterized membrane protein YdbT with pleckstrin-like domain